jgi:hypothetical protein
MPTSKFTASENWTEGRKVESERWQQIKELYLAASEREASERSPFLEEACGEDISGAKKSRRMPESRRSVKLRQHLGVEIQIFGSD